MSIAIEAIFEEGVFRPLTTSINLKEGETVRLVVEPITSIELQRRYRIDIEPDIVREIIESADFGIFQSSEKRMI